MWKVNRKVKQEKNIYVLKLFNDTFKLRVRKLQEENDNLKEAVKNLQKRNHELACIRISI